MAPRVNEGLVSVTILAAVEGVKLVHDMLPAPVAVRTADPNDPAARRAVRIDEFMALAGVTIIAGTISYVTDSELPLVLGLAGAGALVGLYELLLHQPPVEGDA